MTLRTKISAIQHDLKLWVEKSNKMTAGGGYKYFNETDIFNVLKPALAKQGIGYTIQAEGTPQVYKEGNMWVFTSAGVLSLFTNEEAINLSIVLTGMNNDPAKAMGSALTYAIKYWLAKEFCLPTDELDPDTTENTEQAIKNSSAPKAKPAKPATPKPAVKNHSEGVNAVAEPFKTIDDEVKQELVARVRELAVSKDLVDTIKATTDAFQVKKVSDLNVDQLQALIVKLEQ